MKKMKMLTAYMDPSYECGCHARQSDWGTVGRYPVTARAKMVQGFEQACDEVLHQE